MTQYLLSVHGSDADFEAVAPEAIQRMYAQVEAFNKEIQESGAWVFGGGLQPVNTATVVNNTDGKLVTTDGPYLETKEHIGGFWILNAPDLDAALALAAKASQACEGPVEVRPFQDEPA
jgi:hypothetical protein